VEVAGGVEFADVLGCVASRYEVDLCSAACIMFQVMIGQ
jgi:hypothetical protein